MKQAIALLTLLALLVPLAGPAAAEGQFVAPNPKSYDYDRLAKVSDAIFHVDVKKIEGAKNGKMISGGPGSVVDFVCVVKEALKGDVVSGDVVVRAVGHKFYASGRMLMGPALFFVRSAKGESGGRPVYEIADQYGKFFLKAKDPDEIAAMLAAIEKAVARTGAPASASAAPAAAPEPEPEPAAEPVKSQAPAAAVETEVPVVTEPAEAVEPADETDLGLDAPEPVQGTTTQRPGKPAPNAK